MSSEQVIPIPYVICAFILLTSYVIIFSDMRNVKGSGTNYLKAVPVKREISWGYVLC